MEGKGSCKAPDSSAILDVCALHAKDVAINFSADEQLHREEVEWDLILVIPALVRKSDFQATPQTGAQGPELSLEKKGLGIYCIKDFGCGLQCGRQLQKKSVNCLK